MKVNERSKPNKKSTAAEAATNTAAYSQLRHSGFGIASFVISLVAGFYGFIFAAVTVAILTMVPRRIAERPWVVGVTVLFLIFGLGVGLLGIELGITGLIQKERKKTFAGFGLVFNLVLCMLLVTIIVVTMTKF